MNKFGHLFFQFICVIWFLNFPDYTVLLPLGIYGIIWFLNTHIVNPIINIATRPKEVVVVKDENKDETKEELLERIEALEKKLKDK